MEEAIIQLRRDCRLRLIEDLHNLLHSTCSKTHKEGQQFLLEATIIREINLM